MKKGAGVWQITELAAERAVPLLRGGNAQSSQWGDPIASKWGSAKSNHALVVMFAHLLVASIPISLACARVATDCREDEAWFYISVGCLQLACMCNLRLQSRAAQEILHDVFAYHILYGLVSSQCGVTKSFAFGMTAVMLGTRFYYRRCIFIWWKTRRNASLDLILVVLSILCCLRTVRMVTRNACILISFMSHFIDDNNLLFSRIGLMCVAVACLSFLVGFP